MDCKSWTIESFFFSAEDGIVKNYLLCVENGLLIKYVISAEDGTLINHFDLSRRWNIDSRRFDLKLETIPATNEG